MGDDEYEQAAKQNRWGSLAARLEVQCEDVLSMDPNGMDDDAAAGGGVPDASSAAVAASSAVSGLDNGGGASSMGVVGVSVGGGPSMNAMNAMNGTVAANNNGMIDNQLPLSGNAININGIIDMAATGPSPLGSMSGSIGSSAHELVPPHTDLRTDASMHSNSVTGSMNMSVGKNPSPGLHLSNNSNHGNNNENVIMKNGMSSSVSAAWGSFSQQQTLMENELLSPTASPQITTTPLKHWIATKKIEKGLKEATSSVASAATATFAGGGGANNNGTTAMSPSKKQHIQKCVKIALFLVTNLAKSFERVPTPTTAKSDNTNSAADSFDDAAETEDDWEPKPQDIDEECITVSENALTGEIINVGFDIYKNFNWDQNLTEEDEDSSSSLFASNPKVKQLGLIFEALGKLLFKLFMDGEDVPTETNNATSSSNNATSSSIGNIIDSSSIAIPNEDDILDMLRNLPTAGGCESNGKMDHIISAMRGEGSGTGSGSSNSNNNNNRLPMPLCRLVTDIFHTSVSMKTSKDFNEVVYASPNSIMGGGGESDDRGGFCFDSLSDVRSDIQQMVDFPDAFLFGSINSRWELVFGNNHMFGRKTELQLLMDAADRIQNSDGVGNSNNNKTTTGATANDGDGGNNPVARRKKEVITVNGHAGSGKSRLVREIRKPLQARGWLFLRCKFGKMVQPEPLSVIALGLDEYFSSNAVCNFPMPMGSTQEQAVNSSMRPPSCPRKVCERLETLIGLDGLKCLSQQMPSLHSLVESMYSHRRDSLDHISGGLQGKFHTHHLFGTLLDTLASFNPVLFFVDDLQWADAASLELLTDLINRAVTNFDGDNSSTNKILFAGAYRSDNIVEENKLKGMIREFEASDAINTTQISLCGFQLESLNEMVSEALCLPRRKTRSLSEIIHIKTQGVPLFVVEFLDALWTEKLLIHNPVDGWEWDVDAIDLKGISKSVAELLAIKLKNLSNDALSGVQVLSCFGSHVDVEILEAVKNYDGTSGTTLMPALDTAQKEGLLEKAGPTYTFSHDLIQQAAFDLVPVANRVPLLQKLVACLIPCCMLEGGSDSFLFVAVDLINKIGSEAVSENPTQSQLFARLNLEAGKKSMAAMEFSSAVMHFKSGISFLRTNYWKDEYDLSLNLFENSALANYSEGNHEQVVIQVNHVLSNAKSFEDKFKSHCVFINVVAIGSMERATEKIYDLLKHLGENIDPNLISAQVAITEFASIRGLLAGGQKDILLNHYQMTDRTKLMTMKLLAMRVTYYLQQHAFMSGYLACKMIRISLQYGLCDDTVFALSVFSNTLLNHLQDIDEGRALARTALSLAEFYDANQMIQRVYGFIYGNVLVSEKPLQSLVEPLLRACRLSFSNGHFESSTINTITYISRSWQAGKKLPLVMNEINAFAHQHKQQSHFAMLQLFLAPIYKIVSALSGISLDSSELLPQLVATCSEDIVETASIKKEMLYVPTAIALSLEESLSLRNFAQASQIILKYPDFFKMLENGQVRINQFMVAFNAGLVSFHMARETREAHWMEKGTNVVAAFEKFSKINEWNFEHMYLLLKAEMHHTRGETNEAAQAYYLSAEAAQKHRFFHHSALACELAAHYFGNVGLKEKTREMIKRSHDAYMEWGAARKAKAVINLLELKWLDGN